LALCAAAGGATGAASNTAVINQGRRNCRGREGMDRKVKGEPMLARSDVARTGRNTPPRPNQP
jgi:hypothetical protein